MEMNIYQKLAKIRKQVEVIQKNRAGYGYKYVDEAEILAKITAFMEKYDLVLIPNIVPGTCNVIPYSVKKTKASNKGDIYEENVNEVLVSADMVFTWINVLDPTERVEVPWALVGHQSDGSQSFGSGLSYSNRYFLLKFFNVATPDDSPEQWRRKQREAEAAEDKMIAEQIIEKFDGEVRAYLDKHSDKADDLKKFVSKYVKGGDYFKIIDPNMAAKILEDFNKNFKED